jgi:hypothetical protein
MAFILARFDVGDYDALDNITVKTEPTVTEEAESVEY